MIEFTKSWRERIAEARLRGFFTLEDKVDASSSWLTCAVGEQHYQYPLVVTFDTFGSPKDLILRDSGSSVFGFGKCVKINDFDKAEYYLDKIEDRTVYLKREYTAG